MVGPSPGAGVLPELLLKGTKPPGDKPEPPTVGGGGQRGPGRAGCQGWEDVEVGMEVSVRAQAQGGKNSCWSCIIKILLSGAWQSPINPHQGSTQNPLAAAAPCSPGTARGWLCSGRAGGQDTAGLGQSWGGPGWAPGGGAPSGLWARTASGPLYPPTPPPVLGGLSGLPSPLQPLCLGSQDPSSGLPSSFLLSPRLPALLWAAPRSPERSSPSSHPPRLGVVIPWCSPFS